MAGNKIPASLDVHMIESESPGPIPRAGATGPTLQKNQERSEATTGLVSDLSSSTSGTARTAEELLEDLTAEIAQILTDPSFPGLVIVSLFT